MSGSLWLLCSEADEQMNSSPSPWLWALFPQGLLSPESGGILFLGALFAARMAAERQGHTEVLGDNLLPSLPAPSPWMHWGPTLERFHCAPIFWNGFQGFEGSTKG